MEFGAIAACLGRGERSQRKYAQFELDANTDGPFVDAWAEHS